jgi:pyruvate kinase
MPSEPRASLLFPKILATLGPASGSVATIRQLIGAGARAFRINFSHGTFDEHERALANIRAAAEETGVSVAIVGDLCGPKMRVGEVVDAGVELDRGMRVEFQKTPVVASSPDSGAPVVFSTTYPPLVDEVKPRQRVLLDDGKVSLVCIGAEGDGEERRLVCDVVNGGIITSSKGINLPETELSTSALTEKDRACARFAVENGFDFLALSFVRSRNDVLELKDCLRELGICVGVPRDGDADAGPERAVVDPDDAMPIITKIEKPQALEEIDGIIEESDAIMVARGDLGVEMDVAEVPVIQKKLIGRCHEYGRPVIVATQMLESMIEAPTPTRAEVSDVANAILDGADVVMLSGETAVGRWPVEAVRVMNRVAGHTNDFLEASPAAISTPRETREQTAALAHGVAAMVRGLDARLVVLWAQFDGSVIYLSQNRLGRPILGCCARPDFLRRMQLLYGVEPVFMEEPADATEFLRRADDLIQKKNWAEVGDPVVFVLGDRLGQRNLSNLVYIHQVGSF